MPKRDRNYETQSQNNPQYIEEMPSYKKKSKGFSAPRSKKYATAQSVMKGTMPFYKTARLADKQIHTITCADQLNVGFNPTLGLNAAGAFDIVFGVCQNNIVFTSNNAAWNTGLTFANASSAAALFQEYRIIRFEIDVLYSQNAATFTGAAVTSACMPMLYSVSDRENARSLSTSTQALQYASCRPMQLGSSDGSHGKQHISMAKPSCYGVNDNDSTFIGTTSPAQLMYSPWLACGTNTTIGVPVQIPHGYLKFFVDPVATASVNAIIGYITFIAKAVIQYRGID